MTQMTQPPEMPRWERTSRDLGTVARRGERWVSLTEAIEEMNRLEGELRVVTAQHGIARDVATNLSLDLATAEAKLREVQA